MSEWYCDNPMCRVNTYEGDRKCPSCGYVDPYKDQEETTND